MPSDKSKNSHIERTVYVSPLTRPGDSVSYGDWRDSPDEQTWYSERYENPGNVFGRFVARGIPLTIIEYATGSDYSGNLVEISNARCLKRDFPWLVDLHGGYGTSGVAYLGKRENQNDRLIEAIDGLATYPIYDESDLSDLECERESEAWTESYGGRHDFKRALVKFFDGLLDEDYEHDLDDECHDKAVDQLWYACTERLQGGESFLNESGDAIHFPINRVIEKIERVWPGVTTPGYDGSASIQDQLNTLCNACRAEEATSEPVLVHLLRTRGGNECGAEGAHSADINLVTCPDCIALHDSVTIRDSQNDE